MAGVVRERVQLVNWCIHIHMLFVKHEAHQICQVNKSYEHPICQLLPTLA